MDGLIIYTNELIHAYQVFFSDMELRVLAFCVGFLFTESAPMPIQSSSHNVIFWICLSVLSRVITDYAQTVGVSVFYHKINCISIFW